MCIYRSNKTGLNKMMKREFMSYNKPLIDFDSVDIQDLYLSTFKSDIHLGILPRWISLFKVDKSLC